MNCNDNISLCKYGVFSYEYDVECQVLRNSYICGFMLAFSGITFEECHRFTRRTIVILFQKYIDFIVKFKVTMSFFILSDERTAYYTLL